MSFNVNYSTQRLNPTYNEVVYVVSESTSDKFGGFEIVGNIFVNNGNIATMRVQPNPDGFSIFDIHRLVESKLTSKLRTSKQGIFRTTNKNIKRIEVAFTGEADYLNEFNVSNTVGGIRCSTGIEHGLATGETITILNSSVPSYNGTWDVIAVSTFNFDLDVPYVSSTVLPDGDAYHGDGSKWVTTGSTTDEKFIFNGIIDWVDFPSFDGEDYTWTGTNINLLTSIQPDTTYSIDIDSTMDLSAFQLNETFSYVDKIYITTNNGLFSIDNPYSGGTDSEIGLQISCGPANLTGYTGTTTVLTGSLPMIDTDTTDYTVKVSSSIGNTVDYLFTIEDYCSKYDKYNFIFLDKMGSYIPLTFNLSSKIKKSIKKTDYKSSYGSFDSSTSTWGYNTYDRGKKRLNTDVNQKIKITSDYVNETMSGFIEMMIESPEVLVVDPNGNLQAIMITDTSYDVKTRINDKLINHTITFEYSQGNGSQRG